jgi:RNA polymerase sigma-70 factor (ECF subfamily)
MDPRHDTDDQERFAQWVCAHGKAVRGFLGAMVRRADVADELTQEVFYRAWQARSRYRELGSARAYLLRIADRLACDRHRRGEPEVHLDESGWRRHEPPSPAAEPSQTVALVEERELLAEALDRLTASQRRVLLLRYYGQLSYAEIAAAMVCPLNTVLSHAHRGLGTLRQLLVKKSP